MAQSTTALALAAAAAILALAPSAGPSERPPRPERRIALQAGGFGAQGLGRLAERMTAAEVALALRLDPGRHPDLWGRPAAWTSLDLGAPPFLPMKALSAAQALKINAAMPGSLAALAPAPPFVLTGSPAERSRAELCMAQAIYYEAALEPPEGQAAVAQTILNRVRHPYFPKSVCGVVYEGASQPGCQFSFACDGSRERPPIEPFWSRAKAVADAALHGVVARVLLLGWFD